MNVRLDRSLRRSFWMLPALLLAVAALCSAQAVNALVGAGLQVDAQDLARPPSSLARLVFPRAAARPRSASAILARNPFDHVTGPLLAAPPSTEANEGPAQLDTSDPLNAPMCDGLDVDAIAASDDVDWSFAAISSKGQESHLVRRGAKVPGKGVVYFIGWDRLWLSGDSGLCQAKLFGAKKPPPPRVAVVTAHVTTRPGPKPLDPELRKGIQAISATEFNVDRSVVDRILEDQAELMRQARIIPVQENGRVVGVRMVGVRPDSLLGVLGMQNNDRLQTINGFEVANPEKALEAYARLRTADKLTISVNRAGKNMNLDYNIR